MYQFAESIYEYVIEAVKAGGIVFKELHGKQHFELISDLTKNASSTATDVPATPFKGPQTAAEVRFWIGTFSL